MSTLRNIALTLSLLCVATIPATSFAAKKGGATGLPNGKPFQYLNARIDSLQNQINLLIGRVDSLESWQIKAEAALLKLEQQTNANTAAIALLQSELDNINQILATKQDIIQQSCPDKQFVYQILSAPAGLVCRADAGANGLSIYTVDVVQDIAIDASTVLTATCPTGTVIMGGSFNSAPNLTITSSGMVDNGYSVNVANTSGAVLPLTVTGTCLGVAK